MTHSILHNHISTGLMILVFGTLNAFILAQLKRAGLSTENILMVRGGTCVLIVMLVAIFQKKSLIPANPVTQISRGLVATAALFLATTSYRYLHPSSATLIGRVDLPLLGLITARAVSNKIGSKMIGGLAILWLIATAAWLRDPSEELLGYVFAAGGGILVSIGYLFVHHTSRTENWLVVGFTPALFCFLFGSAISLTQDLNLQTLDNQWDKLIISGILMFLLYFAISIRHRSLTPLAAEWPATSIPILALGFDYFALETAFSSRYVIAIVIAAAFVTTQLWLEGRPAK